MKAAGSIMLSHGPKENEIVPHSDSEVKIKGRDNSTSALTSILQIK